MGIGRDSTAPEANPKRATIASVSLFFTQSLFDSDCSLYDPNPSTDVTSPLHSPTLLGKPNPDTRHIFRADWARRFFRRGKFPVPRGFEYYRLIETATRSHLVWSPF